LLIATRAWRQKGDDSLAARIATAGDTNTLSTRAWRQKGIDSVASVRIGGSGVTGYIPKFTAARTLDTSQIYQSTIGNIGIGTNDVSTEFKLDVRGAISATNSVQVFNGTTGVSLRTPIVSSTNGLNAFFTGTNPPLSGTGNQASRNSAFGASSLLANTTGQRNNSFGSPSLNINTTGSNNSAFGSFTMVLNISGSSNSAFGDNALGVSTTSFNSAFGAEALGSLRTGFQNTALGWRAGGLRSTSQEFSKGINSLFLGYDTRSSADSVNNEIVIGASAIGLGSNSVVLGNSSIATTYLRGRTLVNTTTDAGYQFDVAGSMRNTTDAYFNTTSGETYIGTTSDSGAFRLQVNGVAYATDGLRTGAPAGGTAATWKLGTVATVSPTSPNRTIEVDIGGTIYYIHAKTTND
jgi:hypothetical protein